MNALQYLAGGNYSVHVFSHFPLTEAGSSSNVARADVSGGKEVDYS